MSQLALGLPGMTGRAHCTFVPHGQTICTEPAHVHALMSLVPLAAALLCEEHWIEHSRDTRLVDFHAFGDYCNLPNAHWIPSSPTRRGTCLVPDGLTTEVEQFANQPESAHA